MVYSTTVLLVVIAVLTAVFIWSRRTYVYWQRRRVKFVRPTYLLGNLKEVIKQESPFALQLRKFYFDESFANEPLVGIYLFHQPALLIRDLELVRMILVEDFVSFSNRFAKCDYYHEKIAAFNLFFAKNPEWRDIRTKLAPVFTNGRIKQMFSLMEEVGYDLETYLNGLTDKFERHYANNVQIKNICDLYSTDLITSIAFGFRSYSLSNKKSEIDFHSKQMFVLSFKRALNLLIIFFLPRLVPFVRAKFFTKAHAEFLCNTIVGIIKEREQSGVLRNDLIEMLLTFKKEADLHWDNSHFTQQKDYLAAQAGAFEIGGIHTCSSAMAFALYELAKHPHLQDRLRNEIQEVFNAQLDNTIKYEQVIRMEYLGMIVDETLRKYPILPYLERECTPVNRKRFYSFRPYVDCLARRGMPIFISNFAIHNDPKYWPEPETFDPERFSPENRKSVKPMSYLPFGAGPHNCIGSTLGQLQIKIGLLHFLRNHRVECCEKTVDSIKFDSKFSLLSNEDDIYLRVIKCI